MSEIKITTEQLMAMTPEELAKQATALDAEGDRLHDAIESMRASYNQIRELAEVVRETAALKTKPLTSAQALAMTMHLATAKAPAIAAHLESE